MRLALLSLLLLVGCATNPAAPPLIHVQCLPLKAYTQAEQAAVADDLEKLAPGSRLASFLADYAAMRDADRACMAVAK